MPQVTIDTAKKPLVINFPDSMSPAQIQKALDKMYPREPKVDLVGEFSRVKESIAEVGQVVKETEVASQSSNKEEIAHFDKTLKDLRGTVGTGNSAVLKAIDSLDVSSNIAGLGKSIKDISLKMSMKAKPGITVADLKKVVGANKPASGQRVVSCVMKHEYTAYSTMPTKTDVEFQYED